MTVSSWAGWRTPHRETGWRDLTRVLDADVERVAGFPAPIIRRVRSMPADPLNVTHLDSVVHVGTHVDAPVHFIPDGPTAADIPPDRLVGPGVVWHLPVAPLGVIEIADLEAARPRLRRGDMLLLSTGWADRWGDETYHRHPSFSPAAAQWIVDAGATLIAIDFPTPDLSTHLRAPGFDWPVHQVLLRNGVLIIEHMASAEALRGQRVDVIAAALPIADSDGSFVRLLARPLDSESAAHDRRTDA